jgi:hypothetical protein
MQILKYNDINCNFAFENVCSELLKFWTNEVKINNSKIWLTIIVCNKNKKYYTLIKNLPFNTRDYSDVVIVLKQNLDTELFLGKDILETIIFKYHFENRPVFVYKNIFNYSFLILGILTLTFFLYCFYLAINELFFIINIKHEILGFYNDTRLSNTYIDNTDIVINKNYCIFEPFIKLFDTNINSMNYTSKFLPAEFNTNRDNFNLLEYIIYNQYILFDIHTASSTEYITGLHDILQQYQTISDRILL